MWLDFLTRLFYKVWQLEVLPTAAHCFVDHGLNILMNLVLLNVASKPHLPNSCPTQQEPVVQKEDT
jgi:hypothetical protein